MNNPFIYGENIYLRAIERDDLQRCLNWANDPEITQFLAIGRYPFNMLKEEEWLNNISKSTEHVVFAVCLKKNDVHIGNCGLHGINYIDSYATCGILIGEKEYWGKGFGSEAIQLLVDYVFNILNLNRIELSFYDFNERARKCYSKMGFKEEGKLRKRRFRRGRYCDEIMMGLLREEWQNRINK